MKKNLKKIVERVEMNEREVEVPNITYVDMSEGDVEYQDDGRPVDEPRTINVNEINIYIN